MNLAENSQSNGHLRQEVALLRQRVAELEADRSPVNSTSYADFLFENSGETILIIDPYTMKILDANPNAARRFGYERAELCNLMLEQIEMPRQLDDHDAETAWQSSISGTFFYECQYRHKDGSIIPVEVSSRLVFWEGQDVLINFVRDISWRKQAEEALRQINTTLEQQVRERTAELAAEKEKLEAVLGSIVEAVANVDNDRNILYINQAFITMTGYSLAEAQMMNIDTLFDLTAYDRQERADAFNLGMTWSGEVTGWRKDGRSYPTILTMVPMLNEDGRITGYVTSHQDLSRFQALDKAQYSFITNVTHQLRTPLTNIKLYTQLLEGGLNNVKAGHYLQVLISQADRLEHLVQDILELASLDSSDNALEWRDINLAEMVYQMCVANQSRAKEQQLSLDCTVAENMPHISGDATRLRQAINELLDNAFAYTPAGGHISVEVEAPIADGRHWIAITVDDDGPGIAAEERAHIFERFFRGSVAEQGHISGTGLGLCITQQIAQAHHGHVTLHSQPGVGSSFTIWLPLDIL